MPTRNMIVSAALAALACFGLIGCEGAAPAPSEDAVFYFLANARLRGNMRVCWKEGQEYAVAVTKADAALQAQLNPLRTLLTEGAWWAREDPRWADAAKVKEHADELAKLAEEGAKKRAECLESLRTALAELPAGLTWADEAARAAFKDRLWKALDVEGAPLEEAVRRLEDLLAARLALFEKAAACAELSTAQAEESSARESEDCPRAAAELYDAYAALVAAEDERFFSWSAQRLAESAPVLQTIDKQKERERYNLLDNERSYVRARLEAMQKELRELIQADHDEYKRQERSAKRDAEKMDLLEQRAAAREAKLAALLDRSRRIMALGAAGGQSAAP